MAAFKTYLVMLFGLLLAVYLNYPAPTNMSNNLAMWKTRAAKTIIFKKNKIFYKDEPGTKMNAPVLVCLHGFPTSSYDWLKVWPALMQKFSRVIAPDLLGFGFSDKPTDHNYTITEQADLVEHLLYYQRVKEVHILAHDYGDTVAQELLARYEDRLKDGVPKLIIKSVCLLNGGIFPDTNFPQLIQEALLVPYVGDVLARLTNIFTFKRSFGSVFGPETQPSDAEYNDFWTIVRNNDGNLVTPKLLHYIPERTAHKYRWTGVLQKTKVPVHVIYGPADPINPPGFVSFYKEVIPDASITVLQGHIGHYPQWEDSAECMAAYFNFLRTVPYSGPLVSQPVPNVTTSTKITGQKPPPKLVLEKMKARQEEIERAKSGAPEKAKKPPKKELHQKLPKIPSDERAKEESRAVKGTKAIGSGSTVKGSRELPKGKISEKKTKQDGKKPEQSSKEAKSATETKSDGKIKKAPIKQNAKSATEQHDKSKPVKPKQTETGKNVKEGGKMAAKKNMQKLAANEKENVKQAGSAQNEPQKKSGMEEMKEGEAGSQDGGMSSDGKN